MTLTELGRGDFFGEMALARRPTALGGCDRRGGCTIGCSFARAFSFVYAQQSGRRAGTAHGARQPIAAHRRTFASERYAQRERGRSGAAYVCRSRVRHYRGVWRQLEIHHCCGALFQRVGNDQHVAAGQRWF